jgi:triphosphoribosyl-dephospho-CoA synthase
MLLTYLAFLSTWPDSHIVRKRGLVLAQTVTNRAADWYATCSARPAAVDDAIVAQWDAALKSEGLNPGTSADLAVAVAFVAATIDPTLRHR